MPTHLEILHLVHRICRDLDGDVSMASIAHRAGWSAAHLHRDFRRVVTETPKQFTLRVRLERAARRLRESDDRVVDVALASGFTSHEVFSRAFRRHFGRSPREHRARPDHPGAKHRTPAGHDVAPCIGLFHVPTQPRTEPKTMSEIQISKKSLPAQPILFIRRRTPKSAIAEALAQCLPAAYGYCQKHDIPMAGPPFTRYAEMGMGTLTIECGIPTAVVAEGEGEIESGELQAGDAATVVHHGSYETMQETYAKLEAWMNDNGHAPAGAPWETYLTDPGEDPNPESWRTEICWPIKPCS